MMHDSVKSEQHTANIMKTRKISGMKISPDRSIITCISPSFLFFGSSFFCRGNCGVLTGCGGSWLLSWEYRLDELFNLKNVNLRRKNNRVNTDLATGNTNLQKVGIFWRVFLGNFPDVGFEDNCDEL